MEKSVLALDKGTNCSSWNYCGQRLATGSIDGTLAIFDSIEPGSSAVTCISRSRAHEGSIMKVVWAPPEYGDAVICVCVDGTSSLWEEVVEDAKPLKWKICKLFESNRTQVLDVQFGISLTSLKLVAAYSDGYVRVYVLLDQLELKKWQLQAEIQNVIDSVSILRKPSCLSASICWNRQRCESQQSSFVLGYNSDLPQFNSSKVLAVATHQGIAIWHMGLNPDMDGQLSVEKVALLSDHEGQVWQMEWDMSGMTLANTGSDGMVRLWQSNLNGVWHEQAAFEPTS